MAKTKPTKPKSKQHSKSTLNRVAPSPSKPTSPPETPTILLAKATSTLQQGDLDGALPFAKRALSIATTNGDVEDALPALNLLGEIHIELGEIDAARECFLRAAEIDEDGDIGEDSGGGAEKFLWLAQLSEEGGTESVGWFEKGAAALRRQIQGLIESSKTGVDGNGGQILEMLLEGKRRKLAMALCGIVEVYMTDLSWEEDAEQKCEKLVTEATMVAPEVAEPWQTLASVRISQVRMEDARAALRRSLDLWKDLPPEDEMVPDFPTRVSLARLLLEAEMEEEAIEVLERLVSEDDSSVEVWYLGGWGLYIMGEKQKSDASRKEGDADGETYKISWISSRQWLNHSMRLFQMQDYEDVRLGEHARELIAILDQDLGGRAVDEEEDEDDDAGEWEDEDEEDEDEDEEMAEA
jgi:tetratricopeptide (TPR) repeat protein